MRQSLFVGSSPGESERIDHVWKSGRLSFCWKRPQPELGPQGSPGQGGIPQGGARGFPRGDPNVPVADCVRRSPLGTFTFKNKANKSHRYLNKESLSGLDSDIEEKIKIYDEVATVVSSGPTSIPKRDFLTFKSF